MKMKGMFPKILVLVAAAMFLPSLAHAAACSTGALSTYLTSGFSCTIDGLTFSNFTYSDSASGGAIALPASGVTVNPCPGGSFCSQMPSGEVGFEFQGGWSVIAGETEDSAIGYTVSGNIVDALNLFSGFGCTPTGGDVTVDETVSNGQTLNVGCTTGTSSVTKTFAAASTLSVVKDIALTGGTSGTAQVSVVANGWSTATPEPGTIALLGSGLMGLAGLLRKKRLI